MQLFAVGAAFGILIIWYILEILGNWKLFEKAGKPGWHSIVPFLNAYDEYDMCWNGIYGVIMTIALIVTQMVPQDAAQENSMLTIIAGICGVVVLVLQVIESSKLAKAFGKGIGFTILLIIFDRITRIYLGFSDAQYLGKQE